MGGCQGSSWDGAGSRKAWGEGWFLLIQQGDKLGRETMLEDSAFYPLYLS